MVFAASAPVTQDGGFVTASECEVAVNQNSEPKKRQLSWAADSPRASPPPPRERRGRRGGRGCIGAQRSRRGDGTSATVYK